MGEIKKEPNFYELEKVSKHIQSSPRNEYVSLPYKSRTM